MKAIIEIFRRLFALILFLLLAIILAITPTIISLSILLTSRETLPKWIDESGIYTEIPNLVLNQIKSAIKIDGGSMSNFPFKDFEKTLKKTFTPTFLQSNIESFINGGYDWLEGKTENLTFPMDNIDLGPTFKALLPPEMLKNTTLVKQLDNLKPCTEAQAKKYEQLGGFKSVNDACVPPTLDIVKVVDQGYTNVADNKLISFNDIIKTPPITQQTANNILLGYKILDYLPYILVGIIVILSTLFLLLEPSKSFKYYFLGIFTIITASLNLFLFRSNYVLNYMNQIFEKLLSDNAKYMSFAQEIVQNIYNSIRIDIFNIGAITSLYILLGGIIILAIAIAKSILHNRKV